MKKFIAGLVVGHILTNGLYLYVDGGFDRVRFLIDFLKTHPGEYPSFPAMVEYIMVGTKDEPQPDPDETPEISDEAREWYRRIQRVGAMADEMYTVSEIADTLDISEVLVNAMLRGFKGGASV
jgi:hypothetical protein